MALKVAFIVCLFAGSHALGLSDANSDREWKEAPVTKVVAMLKDMVSELENEQKKDQDLYDKLGCWCETNEKEKTLAIATAEKNIKELTASIESNTAKGQQLETDIKNLKAEVAANTAALEEASAVREKELAEFNQNEKDTITSLQSLKGALNTLGKHNKGASFIQEDVLVHLTHTLRSHIKNKPTLMTDAILPHQRRLLQSLLQRPEGFVSLLQQQPGMDASGATSYNSQSGEIFGMLQQMKETMETDSVKSKKEEEEAAAAYVQLQEAKNAEIKAAKGKIFSKTEEAANAAKTVANNDMDLENNENCLAADTEFLANLKKTCANVDAQFEARTKTRQEEMKAVSDTIAFLDSDEAHDLFTKSLGFFQLRAESQLSVVQREKARQFLADEGNRLRSRRLSFLASRMKFDPFGKMRENIDGMTGALGKEKEDEIEFKDECVDDFNVNEKQTNERSDHKNDLDHDIANLEDEIGVKTDEEKMLEQEIYDAQVEMKKASQNRELENKDFQVVIADQRATQKILNMAVERLGDFYNKKAASLLQRRASTRQVPGAEVEPMPEGFGEYKKSNGGGAITMIQGIIDESKAVEKDALVAESDAQVAYEGYVQDTNKEIEDNRRALTADEEVVAKDKEEEIVDEEDKHGTVKDILKLADVSQNLHKSCDFTLDNFDVRQKSRDDEVEALKQAKAIFSGAGFGR
jgi:hypothetical protein